MVSRCLTYAWHGRYSVQRLFSVALLSAHSSSPVGPRLLVFKVLSNKLTLEKGFTPTAGLGCRTGGYLIHIVLALALLFIEVGIWSLTHDTTHTKHDIMRRVSTTLERRFTDPEKGLQHDSRIHRLIEYLHSRAFRDVIKVLIIRPLEAFNAGWLTYIIFAQTFGSYQTCDCMGSTWTHGEGGFIDFQSSDVYDGHSVYTYWSVGVALSCVIMTGGLCYIAHEYCTQGHMSTEHYGRAMQGLKWTRWYKKHTRFVRFLPNKLLWLAKKIGFAFTRGKTRRTRRSLVWTVHEKPKVTLGGVQADQIPENGSNDDDRGMSDIEKQTSMAWDSYTARAVS